MPLPLILGAAAAYSAKKTYDNYRDKSTADSIMESAKANYESAKKNFDNRNKWYIKESLNNFYNINWILVIIWDLTFITKKYSYRSYIYQLIEVWEILQNLTIYSMSKSLNISAFGWFIEEELKNIIKIRDNSIIYSVIIF